VSGIGTAIGRSRAAQGWLIVGLALVLAALATGTFSVGLVGIAVLAGVGLALFSQTRGTTELEPWPWTPHLRAQAEAMARPIDPTPERLLPPDPKAVTVAEVATTKDALARLIADKPKAWTWAAFTSVLVQRRNAVQKRLRAVVSGYQPRGGAFPLSGNAYSVMAFESMNAIVDLVRQMEQFMLSPAFKGAFGGDTGDGGPDSDAIVSVAKRLMDYHDALLGQAEICLQTPVNSEAFVFVQDMGAFTLCPLVGYQQFITTMCARIGEAQELLPYTSDGDVIALDDVNLAIDLPDGLMEQLMAHIKRFNQ